MIRVLILASCIAGLLALAPMFIDVILSDFPCLRKRKP